MILDWSRSVCLICYEVDLWSVAEGSGDLVKVGIKGLRFCSQIIDKIFFIYQVNLFSVIELDGNRRHIIYGKFSFL